MKMRSVKINHEKYVETRWYVDITTHAKLIFGNVVEKAEIVLRYNENDAEKAKKEAKSFLHDLETGQRIDDGLYRVFVNTEVKDGTTISEYMECFLKKEVNNSKFPEFTDRMNILKHEERGLDAVCEVMERYERKAIERSNVDSIKYMITTFGATEDQVLGNKNYSKTEYNTALKELSEERKAL